MNDRPQMTDKATIRSRARERIEQGAVTDSYRGDPAIVIGLLNEALATEIVCQLRYKRHYFTAQGIASEAVAGEFLQHAKDEEQHADWIAARIVQLGGEPNFSPDGLSQRSHAEYVAGDTLTDMIREDLVAERIAIESYAEMIRYLGDVDITSRRLLEKILEVEEEHADDLVSLIQGMQKVARQVVRVAAVDALVRAVLARAAARRLRDAAQRNPARKRPVKEPDRKKRKPVREPRKPPVPIREPGEDPGDESAVDPS